ncbi:MAG: hypothetical protein DDT18_01726 [Actinobacteria bacterium]|nr:hypothetical protein [Actinomycetota bacterium]
MTLISIRQQIMDRVRARLQSITVANGFGFNLGANVFEWQVTPLQEVRLPAIVYRDVENSIELIEAHRNRLGIEIEIMTRGGDTPIADMRRMIADVHRAIGTDIQWGTLALNTYPQGDRISREIETQNIVGAVINIVIEFRTREWMPHQQI